MRPAYRGMVRAALLAAARVRTDHITDAAESVASMVIEWVDGGIAIGTDWRPGLAAIIGKRLRRFEPESEELATIKRLAATGTAEAFLQTDDETKRFVFALATEESQRRKEAEGNATAYADALANESDISASMQRERDAALDQSRAMKHSMMQANADACAARAQAEALATALRRVGAPLDCGCKPCVGQCRSQEALRIIVDEMQDTANAALAAYQPLSQSAEGGAKAEDSNPEPTDCVSRAAFNHNMAAHKAARPAPAPEALREKAREIGKAVWIIGNRIHTFETKQAEIDAAILAALVETAEAERAACEAEARRQMWGHHRTWDDIADAIAARSEGRP